MIDNLCEINLSKIDLDQLYLFKRLQKFFTVSSDEAKLYIQIIQNIEYEIIGEGSQISTNQKRESTVSWLLIGRNL